MHGKKWTEKEIEETRAHAKGILAKKSNLYRSTNALLAGSLAYRTFASIINRLRKDVYFLTKNHLYHIAAGDIEPLILPKKNMEKNNV